MSGGTFVKGVKKERPGFYADFKNVAATPANLSDRGTVIMPLFNHNWGPLKTFIKIDATDLDGQYSKLGYKIIDMLLPREVLKRAKTLIAYIPGSGGAKATVTVAPLTVTANYEGTRGNDLRLVVVDNAISGKDVLIYLDTEILYKAEGIVTVAELSKSDWVTFSGTGNLANTAGIKLSGGANITMTNGDVTDFLNDSEVEDWNVMCFPTEDATLKSAFNTKIKYFRESIGKIVTGVTADNPADYEGIIDVENGVILADGTELTNVQATAWVAGASASAKVNEDLTNISYDDSIDAKPRLKHNEIIDALKAGKFIFKVESSKAVVENDINSLVTLTQDRDETYQDNRAIRVFDEVVISGSKLLKPNKYDNDNDGQNLAKQDLLSILGALEGLHAVKNVDIDNDVQIDTTASIGDELYAQMSVQPVRSIKKYYINVNTRG